MPLTFNLTRLEAAFGARVQTGAPLARYTSARVGGPADVLLELQSVGELSQAAQILWQAQAPFTILGGGSNVLVSDAGVRGVVIINRARSVRFDLGGPSPESDPPTVWAESGANFGLLARQASQYGLAGLEWAAGIPGTLGGAVVGNAGAHGGDMAGNLILAEILHHVSSEDAVQETWPVDRFEYEYRSSRLKRQLHSAPGAAPETVVLSALLRLERSSVQAVQATSERFVEHRRRTQPPGASMGSMFKNPPGDYAGRLIEAAGLKGLQVGQAQISPLHANFFLNLGGATAADVFHLIQHARQVVFETTGVRLELEIELLGEW